MKNNRLLCILVFFIAATSFSQRKDVLLTINNQDVFADEFEHVYKKNLELVKDDSQKDIDGYLDLFIDYKLKVFEARAQGLDQSNSYRNEFSKYRDQLSSNYLFETEVTDLLVREAYERGKEEIHAAHILINIGAGATPKDTLIAYEKINSIREKALAGEDFTSLAKTYSQEPNAAQSGGDLGYFSVFNMVYPFETGAYNTPVGEVSEIIRTRFGYHILKVIDRRERAPEIVVSHIMISDKKGERNFDPEARIKEIENLLKQGNSFESLAKEYSDDTGSAVKGGRMRAFSRGQLRSPKFEEAAYSLAKAGDITGPVFTEFGWHLIRLDEIAAPESFEDQEQVLRKRVENSDRAVKITTSVNNKIKEKYGFKKGEEYLPFFENYLSDSIFSRSWKREPIAARENKTLFTIGKQSVTYEDFGNFIENYQIKSKPYRNKTDLLNNYYNEFKTQVLNEYLLDQLEKENREYAAILNEYRDGLLIFDVMQKNIWDFAKADTLGQRNYYERNKENYRWQKRADAVVFSMNSQKLAEEVKQNLEKGKSPEAIKELYNSSEVTSVMISEGLFESGDKRLPENLDFKPGVSAVYPREASFVVVHIKEIVPESIKEFDEVKGRVISDYQNEVEDRWNKKLKSKYSVTVNKRALKRLKRKLK